jgi:protein SCO1/2
MKTTRRSLRGLVVGTMGTAAVGLAAVGLALVGPRGASQASDPKASLPASLPYYDGPTFTPHWRPVEHHVGAFQLLDQQGRAFRETDLEGRIHVASFFFGRCPNVCPTLVSRLRRVQDVARTLPDVRLVSYSVTPTLDTPRFLSDYGRQHGIDPSVWTLATGDAAQIESLARDSYFADDRRSSGGTEEPAGLLHTEKVLLVDGQCRLRGIYDGTQPFEIGRLLEDIVVLRAEGTTSDSMR